MFAISGEKLTKRLRSISFKSMLSQEVGWYFNLKLKLKYFKF